MTECCPPGFNRSRHFGSTNPLQRLLINLKYYFDYSLLQIGGFINIEVQPEYSGHAELKPVYTPGYSDGQVYQGLRKRWVYEEGITYTDPDGSGHQPILDPIITVDGSGVYPSGDYLVDYDLGRIIFDDPLPTGLTLYGEYSAKNVQIYLGSDPEWIYEQVQPESYDYTTHFQLDKQGNWFIGGQHRVQLPAIVIFSTGNAHRSGYELGDRTMKYTVEVIFQVIAEDPCGRNNLIDLILMESEKCINLFNPDEAIFACDLTLYNNQRQKAYPELVSDYYWANCRSYDGLSFDCVAVNRGLYSGLVRMTYDVFFSSL